MDLQEFINSADFEHCRKVSKISELLAEYMGYPCNEAKTIGYAALFHDIGKSDVPQDILNKPGPLTEREFEIIKMHAQLGGARISELQHFFSAAEIIARDHHEKWDGTGYNGFIGKEIHPYARLVAVADVLDALVSKRIYKDAWSINDTLEYLIKQSGIQFDTNVVTALLSHTDEIVTLYR